MIMAPPEIDQRSLRRLVETEWKIEKKRCEDYNFFFRAAWPEIEPVTPLSWNWHIDVLCKEIQEQAERIALRKAKEYDIIVNIPPRSLKSKIFSVLAIPYIWTKYPGQKFITGSISKELALEHAVDSRALIQSPWYQRHWGDKFELVSDQNMKSFFKNSVGGYRIAVSVGQSTIGRGGDWEFIDDPNDPNSSESKIMRLACINWYLKVMFSRINSQKIGIRVIIQQRTFEDDLSGYLLANYPAAYKHFCFPGEETDDISPPEVRNYYKKGLFFPERFTHNILQDYRITLKSDYAGQILQRPAPPEGNIFKRQWFRYWKPKGMPLPELNVRVGDKCYTAVTVDLPESFDDKITSWDMGLKGKADNDPSSGQVLATVGPDIFLLDRSYGLYNDLQCEIEAEALKNKYPDVSAILIEDEAAGTPVIRRMRTKMPGVIGIQPKGSKRNRARPLAALTESGNFYLPRPEIAPWVEEYIEEFLLFDRGTHDDNVDAADQGVNYLLSTRRVFNGYNGQARAFRVDWETLSRDYRLLIGQYVERNLRSYIVVGLYNAASGVLRVMGEIVTDNASPEIVLPKIKAFWSIIHAESLSIKRVSWYGNDVMFSKATGDVSEQYTNKQIYIQQVEYNEPGAILKTMRQITSDKLILHTRATQTIEDLKLWKYDKAGKPEDGCGMARAVCLTQNAIDENLQYTKPKGGLKPYSKEKTEMYDAIDDLAKRGELDKHGGHVPRISSKDSGGWACY